MASITPELPLADMSVIPATFFAHSERLSLVLASEVRTRLIVMLMLTPVSPSGTGYTFRLLISSLLFSSALAAETTISRKDIPVIVII